MEVFKMWWYDPMFEEIRRMQRDMDRAIYADPAQKQLVAGKEGDKALAKAGDMQSWRMPRCNLCETKNGLMANFELPGVDKADIQLNVTDSGIEVKVEKDQKKEQKGKDGSYSYMSSSQSFYRHIQLPRSVDASRAKAEYKNGVLSVEIPNAAKAKTKRIEVR
jgi:HSP20 family protein